MVISTIAYQKFYEILIDQFASNEISFEELQKLGHRSYLIWDAKDPETKESLFLKIFHRHTTDPRHFYKKLGQFDPSKTSEGFMNDGLMIQAFNYIGLAIPSEIKLPNLLPIKQKVQILYQLFLERHFHEFWAENSTALKVYDHENQKLIDELKQTNKSKSGDKVIPMEENEFVEKTEEVAVKALIKKFYELVSQSIFDEAWKLLTPSFQKRVWKDNFEKFSLGYTNTINIHDVHVFQTTRSASDVKCKVYYEDDVVTYTSLELSNINKISVGNLETFLERVKKLQESASTIGLNGFERIELQKFFEPTVSEYLWYKCGIEPDLITDLLPSQEIITMPRLYHISCILLNDHWLIKGIHPIKSYAIR